MGSRLGAFHLGAYRQEAYHQIAIGNIEEVDPRSHQEGYEHLAVACTLLEEVGITLVARTHYILAFTAADLNIQLEVTVQSCSDAISSHFSQVLCQT
jgi:hypothetical protein